MSQLGGLVLAGGRSRRMGREKASLPFGPELLVQRICRIVGEVATRVVVVAAADQQLPPLPATVAIARDRQSDRGPLEALAAGLRCLDETEIVFVTACDAPLLTPALIRLVCESLDTAHDAAVPVVDGLPQPLLGAYRGGIRAVVEDMLRENRLKLLDLLDQIRVRVISADALRRADPKLGSLRNLNTPAEYQATLAAAGFVEENRTVD